MSTIFMNSENSKTPDPYRLVLTPTDKTYLQRGDKHIHGSVYMEEYKKSCTGIIKLKY